MSQLSTGIGISRPSVTWFAVIHGRAALTEKEFGRQLGEARQKVLAAALTDVPAGRHSQNLKRRFERHGAAYFQFLTTPGVEPTIRRMVLPL